MDLYNKVLHCANHGLLLRRNCRLCDGHKQKKTVLQKDCDGGMEE